MAETFYFSHDYDSRQDEKIKNLIYHYGFEGYGIFWALIEDLYINENMLKCDYKRIAYEFRVDEIKVKSIINEFGLFTIEGDNFYSISINKRLDFRNEKKVKAKLSAEKRWKNATPNANASKNDANASKTHATEHANASKNDAIKESKVKESKVKDIKGESISTRTLVECLEIFTRNGKPEYAESFYNYYESIGWVKAGNPIVNLTAAVQTWILKEQEFLKNKTNKNANQRPLTTGTTRVEQYKQSGNNYLRAIGELDDLQTS
jgi:uncharacterized protein YdaU (DUF1376 family)